MGFTRSIISNLLNFGAGKPIVFVLNWTYAPTMLGFSMIAEDNRVFGED